MIDGGAGSDTFEVWRALELGGNVQVDLGVETLLRIWKASLRIRKLQAGSLNLKPLNKK